MPTNTTKATQPPAPVTGYFEGERLELNWREAYRPEFIPLLMDYLGAGPGIRILDVGCGSGFLARLLARALADVQIVGLDADHKMLALAQQMLAREDLADRMALQQGDTYRLPYPAETFNLVTSHTLL